MRGGAVFSVCEIRDVTPPQPVLPTLHTLYVRSGGRTTLSGEWSRSSYWDRSMTSNRRSSRFRAASICSSESFDSALPRWMRKAVRITKVNSCKNSLCQFSNVDCQNSNKKALH
jgi:hypothetical protein